MWWQDSGLQWSRVSRFLSVNEWFFAAKGLLKCAGGGLAIVGWLVFFLGAATG